MPFYQRRGDVPRKRHIVFREDGALLTEEVMGLEGFTGNESILYHLVSPCRVKELGAFTPIEREEWVPEKHAHLLMNTYDIAPEGDEISGRRTLMWNEDVEISLCRPDSQMDYFFRNGEGDEVIFVHEGSGTLETIFGDVPYTDGDYVVIPAERRTVCPGRPAALPRVRDARLIEIAPRYRNQYGRSSRGLRTTTATSIRRPSSARIATAAIILVSAGPWRVPGVRPRLPPVRRRRVGRVPLSLDVLHPRLRADHRPDPSAAAVTSDVPGAELRHLLVLPAEARLRPRRCRSRTTTRTCSPRR
jgi:hypothetical protein